MLDLNDGVECDSCDMEVISQVIGTIKEMRKPSIINYTKGMILVLFYSFSN